MPGFLHDLRFALRMTAKSPGFTAIAVITLALGIGATVASFSLMEAVLWNSLPYRNVDQLVQVGQADLRAPTYWRDFSGPDYIALKQHARSYSQLAAYEYQESHNLVGGNEPQHVDVTAVTADFFPLLGKQAFLGRLFSDAEERSANASVAVLSYAEWQSQFGGDPKVPGSIITLDDQRRTVIGVSPPEVNFNDAQIFIPLATDGADFLDPNRFTIDAIGRLAAGKTVAAAKAELDGIVHGLAQSEPDGHKEYTGWMHPFRELHTQYYERKLVLFIVVAAIVLIIACVNVANLLLARSVERQTEFAVRAALGASRWPLMRQLLAESLVLASLATALGVVLAVWGVRALTAFADPAAAGMVPKYANIVIDARALLLAVALVIATAVLFGIAPAMLASKVNPERWLKSATRSQTGSRSRRRLRDALVIAEVALALVLTVAGGLFVRSLFNLEHADLGFNPDHLLTLHLSLRGSAYSNPVRVAQFYESLAERTRALPGVQGAVVANNIPMTSSWSATLTVVGGTPVDPTRFDPVRNRGTLRGALQRVVMGNYFRILGIPLLRGRGIEDQDTPTSPRVVVINENLARRYFGSFDPIGRQLRLELHTPTGKRETEIAEIIGVSRNNREIGINEAAFDSIYLPFAQHPEPEAFLAVRTAADPAAMAKLVHKEIAALDPTQPVYGLPTMEQRIRAELSGDRFNATIVALLAVLALALALVGIYAVIAYTVSQRVHEIGIRMALGAHAGDVMSWIVSRSGVLVAGGVVAGAALTLIIGRLLGNALFLVETKHEGMLYGVTLHDPVVLAIAAAMLALTALAASYAPARRATKVDPMEALRCE